MSFKTKTCIWNEGILKQLWFAPIIWKTALVSSICIRFLLQRCQPKTVSMWLDQLARDEQTQFTAGKEWHCVSANLGWSTVSTHQVNQRFLTACCCPRLFFSSACFALMLVILRFFCLLSFRTSKVSDTGKADKGPETHTVCKTSAADTRLCGKAIQSPSGKPVVS